MNVCRAVWFLPGDAEHGCGCQARATGVRVRGGGRRGAREIRCDTHRVWQRHVAVLPKLVTN